MNFLNTRKMFLQPHCKNIIELIFPCFSRFYMYGLLSIDCKSIPAKSNHCALVNIRCMSKRIILRTKTKYKAFRRTLLWFHGTFQFHHEIMNRKKNHKKRSVPNFGTESARSTIGNVQFSRKTPICKYYAIFQFGIAYLIPKNKEINTKNTLLTIVQIFPSS